MVSTSVPLPVPYLYGWSSCSKQEIHPITQAIAWKTILFFLETSFNQQPPMELESTHYKTPSKAQPVFCLLLGPAKLTSYHWATTKFSRTGGREPDRHLDKNVRGIYLPPGEGEES